MDALDDLVDLSQAAAELGLAPVTLRAAIKNGTFRARKFGNSWITTRSEVLRYREDVLGRVGRPARLPMILGYVRWPLGAYPTHTLLLGTVRGIDESTHGVVEALASRAIEEGAWQLAEVISKVRVDSRLRGFDVYGDPRVPALIVDPGGDAK